MANEGPIYVAENSSGVKQVKTIISSAQNGSMRSEEFATIQFLARDVEIAPRCNFGNAGDYGCMVFICSKKSLRQNVARCDCSGWSRCWG